MPRTQTIFKRLRDLFRKTEEDIQEEEEELLKEETPPMMRRCRRTLRNKGKKQRKVTFRNTVDVKEIPTKEEERFNLRYLEYNYRGGARPKVRQEEATRVPTQEEISHWFEPKYEDQDETTELLSTKEDDVITGAQMEIIEKIFKKFKLE